MTAPTIRPALWSGHDWVDRLNPDDRLVTGRAYDLLKRAFDIAVVVMALPLWAVVMGICAAMVKLDDPSAPVLFTQRRTGIRGEPFAMHKFRTMVPGADSMKGSLAHLNELEPPDFKITDDPRITRPGRFLRAGEKYRGYTVRDVTRRGAILCHGKKSVEVPFGESRLLDLN